MKDKYIVNIGDSNINIQGHKMTIVKILPNHRVGVVYNDDPNIYVEMKKYNFIHGTCKIPRYKIGTTIKTKQGYNCTLLEYKDCYNVIVQFDDEHKAIVLCRNDSFRLGKVQNPYHPTVQGVAYIGEPNYIDRKSYVMWESMIKRCYNPNQTNFKAYAECKVCDEWLSYANFKIWYDENYYKCEETLSIDKDIIKPNNKIYSPNTCILIPIKLNALMRASILKAKGVTKSSNSNYPYRVVYEDNCKLFATYEEAHIFYKTYKYNHIIEEINKYSDIIPCNIIEKLLNSDYLYNLRQNNS